MAERRPLVLIDGKIKELPTGDTVYGASGGGGGGGNGGFVPIKQIVVSVAQPSIDFTGIPNDGDDLVLVLTARGTAAGYIPRMTLNADSGTNYTWRTENRYGTVLGNPSAYMDIGAIANSTAPANTFGSTVVEITNYAKAQFKQIRVDSSVAADGAIGNLIRQHNTGKWRSTAVVNQLTIVLDSGNFDVGTVATLYKRKAASSFPVKPLAADFTTLRNGVAMTAATIADNAKGGGVVMTFNRNSVASNWKQSYILKTIAGGVPFRAEALIVSPYQSSNNWFSLGLAISTDNAADVGKHLNNGIFMDGGSWTFTGRSTRNNGLNAQETGFTTVFSPNTIAQYANEYWLAIEYDGTDIVTYVSIDGYHWFKTASEPKTFFTGTPNLVGFGWEAVASDGGTHYAWCRHFRVTTDLTEALGLNR